MNQDLDPLLRRLNLANTRRTWSELVRRAEKEAWSFEAFLQTLCAEEIAHRRGTRLTRAVRAAAFPFLRTIEEFDFSFQSTLRLTTIGSLLSPDFITQGNAVILEGKPGRGKTHLAVAIAYRALQNGFDALFTTAAELIDDLSVASRSGKLRETLSPYLKPHVLVVDEVGYLTYGTDAANVFFHVVNERHVRHKAMIFTTNKHPKLWGSVLHDDQLAEAIVDRILERGRLLRLDGPSVRTKHLAQDDLIDEAATQNQGRRISGIHAAEFPERTATNSRPDEKWACPSRSSVERLAPSCSSWPRSRRRFASGSDSTTSSFRLSCNGSTSPPASPLSSRSARAFERRSVSSRVRSGGLCRQLREWSPPQSSARRASCGGRWASGRRRR